jgi:hypothetical protein
MHTRLSLAVLTALALTACKDDPVVCTDIAVGSVNVTVHDAADAAVPDVALTYTVDGGDPVACEEVGLADGASFVCGYEVEGEITVTATAPGFDDATDTVTIVKTEDGCHVIGQAMTLVMTATAPL